MLSRCCRAAGVSAAGLLLLFSTTSPLHASTPVTNVPPAYQDLYYELTAYLQVFAAEVASGSNGSNGAVGSGGFSAQLKTASSDNGMALLDPSYYTNFVLPELNELKALGVKSVMVVIDFPVLYPNFYGTATNTYQSYLNFYIRLASDVRSRGLKLIVGNSTTSSLGGFNTWNVAPFYAGMSISQFEAARAQQAVTIAQQIKPDYMTVVAEPDTEALQTGFGGLATVAGSTGELNTILNGLRQAHVTGTWIGAGIGSWTSSWQSWLQSFAQTGVQYLDVHVFPVNGAMLTQLPAIASYAASLGKPLAMSQVWLGKVRDSEVATMPYYQWAARDPFDFWAPLDTSFVQSMVGFANWKHLLFVSPFWTPYFHAYVPYQNSISTIAAPQLQAEAESLANQAIQSGAFSSTGWAYGAAITSPRDATPPSAPTGLSGAANASQVYLSWNASTDNVGVAGYLIFRNGVLFDSTSGTTYRDLAVTPATHYSYTVAAYDGARNVSGQSGAFGITTLPAYY